MKKQFLKDAAGSVFSAAQIGSYQPIRGQISGAVTKWSLRSLQNQAILFPSLSVRRERMSWVDEIIALTAAVYVRVFSESKRNDHFWS